MVSTTIALFTAIILTAFSLFFIYFVLRRLKVTYAKKLFYFDLVRFLIRILIVGPIIMSALGGISPLIFNAQNLKLPPPGLATIEQWFVWWLGAPLSEFTQVDSSIGADIFAVAKGSSSNLLLPLLAGFIFVSVLDFLWAYKNNKYSKIIRTVFFGFALVSFIIWTLVAFTITPNIPGAGDLKNRWLFMKYWQFTPWVVALLVFETFFSFWLPLIVIGYLIYKSWKEK